MTRLEVEQSRLENDGDIEVLHEEVERLPHKYREAVVLCYLNGMSLEAAAGQIGCPISTLGVRLMRARERLRTRLTRRRIGGTGWLARRGLSGTVSPSGAAGGAGQGDGDDRDAPGDGGIVRLAAAKLTAEVLRSMVMTRLVTTGATIIVALAALVYVGGLAVSSRMLNAGQVQLNDPVRAPARWIGQKVVTKYRATDHG